MLFCPETADFGLPSRTFIEPGVDRALIDQIKEFGPFLKKFKSIAKVDPIAQHVVGGTAGLAL